TVRRDEQAGLGQKGANDVFKPAVVAAGVSSVRQQLARSAAPRHHSEIGLRAANVADQKSIRVGSSCLVAHRLNVGILPTIMSARGGRTNGLCPPPCVVAPFGCLAVCPPPAPRPSPHRAPPPFRPPPHLRSEPCRRHEPCPSGGGTGLAGPVCPPPAPQRGAGSNAIAWIRGLTHEALLTRSGS